LRVDAYARCKADLDKLGIIDGIVTEPLGGAHREPEQAIRAVGDAIDSALRDLGGLGGDALRANRRDKFLAMGREALA
ncbi:MAG: acetyl-CoA carboxylase carboxyl transferase subunit alpha, partial [Alphaproteobacteria bacterium]